MKRIRGLSAALLAVALASGPVSAQVWTNFVAADIDQNGVPLFDRGSGNGHCNLGYIVFGIRDPLCNNGTPASGWWVGGSAALVSGATASYVDPGASFKFTGKWKFEVLGGFRGFAGGWGTFPKMGINTTGTASDPNALNFTAPGTYYFTGTAFSLAMPGTGPGPTQKVLSGGPAGAIPQYALINDGARTGAFGGGLYSGRYIIGFEDTDITAKDQDYNDVVVIATALPVPEPASIALVATGLLGLVGVARKKRS